MEFLLRYQLSSGDSKNYGISVPRPPARGECVPEGEYKKKKDGAKCLYRKRMFLTKGVGKHREKTDEL